MAMKYFPANQKTQKSAEPLQASPPPHTHRLNEPCKVNETSTNIWLATRYLCNSGSSNSVREEGTKVNLISHLLNTIQSATNAAAAKKGLNNLEPYEQNMLVAASIVYTTRPLNNGCEFSILRLVYIGVFTSTKTLAFWPQFLCLSSWMYMTAKASKSMHLGT